MTREEFERLVSCALNELPREFAERLDNVAVVVEDEPTPDLLERAEFEPDADGEVEELFGLYVGVSLIDRDTSYAALPDCIYIFMGPILRYCRTPSEVVREVRDTVIHEIGHHFGLSDEEMPY